MNRPSGAMVPRPRSRADADRMLAQGSIDRGEHELLCEMSGWGQQRGAKCGMRWHNDECACNGAGGDR